MPTTDGASSSNYYCKTMKKFSILLPALQASVFGEKIASMSTVERFWFTHKFLLPFVLKATSRLCQSNYKVTGLNVFPTQLVATDISMETRECERMDSSPS